MKAWTLGLVAAAVFFSGCTSIASPSETQEETMPSSEAPGASDSPGGTPETSTPPPGDENDTSPGPNATPSKPWPAPADAIIRPGVRVVADGAQCTSNFVFRDLNNTTLYLGLAAHCVSDLKRGDNVTITGATHPGKIAYSSWMVLNLTCPGDPTEASDEDSDPSDCEKDFAVIEIDARDRDKVSPAVLHFGGPTRLMYSKDLGFGDRVLFYGNSGLRDLLIFEDAQEDSNRHEGFVDGAQGAGPVFSMYTVTPGVPGDSGSGVMTRDGEAVGILTTVAFAPFAGENGVVGLKGALELAKSKGFEVELATWAQSADGILP